MLVRCEECGGQVSTKAVACPHCGCPINIEETAFAAEVYFCGKCGVSGTTTWWKNKAPSGKGCCFCGSTMIGVTYESENEIQSLCQNENKEIQDPQNPNIINDWIVRHYLKNKPSFDPSFYQLRLQLQNKHNINALNVDDFCRYRKKMHDDFQQRNAYKEAHTPHCPNCHSTSISKISTLSRAVSTYAWGIASSKIGKTMQCNKCGYKW